MHKQKVMLQNVGPHNQFVRHRGRLQLAQRRPRITLTEHRYMLYESLPLKQLGASPEILLIWLRFELQKSMFYRFLGFSKFYNF